MLVTNWFWDIVWTKLLFSFGFKELFNPWPFKFNELLIFWFEIFVGFSIGKEVCSNVELLGWFRDVSILSTGLFWFTNWVFKSVVRLDTSTGWGMISWGGSPGPVLLSAACSLSLDELHEFLTSINVKKIIITYKNYPNYII